MRVCLFEDHGVIDLDPLTLTRPVFDLLCGTSSLGAKQVQYFGAVQVAALVRPSLQNLVQEQRPDWAVNDSPWLRRGPAAIVNGRWLPDADSPLPVGAGERPGVATVGSEVAYAIVTPDRLDGLTPETLEEFLARWKQELPRYEAGGTMIARPWELVDHNRSQIEADFRTRATEPTYRPLDFSMVGPAGMLSMDPSVRLDPLVVADTTNGPVIVDRDAVIGAFSKLEGPCYIGPGSHVFGARIRAGTSIGPYCRVGGEVEQSIMHGFSNKYHDGFLGHSYVGEWVNIGAGAQTSDLRHDYAEVIVTVGGLKVPTGQSKVGSFIGDHSKIGLGSLLNTGTNVGAFASILPAGKLLPRYVPSFCAVNHGMIAENDQPELLLATAVEVMRRRGVRLTETQRELYLRVFDQTVLQRKQALRSQEPRRTRRSA